VDAGFGDAARRSLAGVCKPSKKEPAGGGAKRRRGLYGDLGKTNGLGEPVFWLFLPWYLPLMAYH
jgi:hypothetical protein